MTSRRSDGAADVTAIGRGWVNIGETQFHGPMLVQRHELYLPPEFADGGSCPYRNVRGQSGDDGSGKLREQLDISGGVSSSSREGET